MEAADLLISPGTLPHRNLSVWSAELGRRLASLNLGDRSPNAVGRLISLTNEAALVEAHRGDYESAAKICDKQLANLRRHPEVRTFAIARHAVNPWLNLGRLASLAGRASQACETFARFREPTAVVDLNGITVNLSELNARLRAEKGYPDFCAHLYVGNSLRALVRNGAWPALAAFADSCTSIPPPMRPIVDEARVVASMYLGRPEEALEVAKAHRHADRLYTRLTFRIRELECLGRMGRRAESGSWAQLEDGLGEMMTGQERSVGSLALGLYEAKVAVQHDALPAAQRVAARCLATAQLLGDEVFTYAALRLLSSCSAGSDAASYGEMAATIEANSEYQSIRGKRRRRSYDNRELADAAFDALA